MNKLPLPKRVQMLSMLVEGSSMRSISRVVGKKQPNPFRNLRTLVFLEASLSVSSLESLYMLHQALKKRHSSVRFLTLMSKLLKHTHLLNKRKLSVPKLTLPPKRPEKAPQLRRNEPPSSRRKPCRRAHGLHCWNNSFWRSGDALCAHRSDDAPTDKFQTETLPRPESPCHARRMIACAARSASPSIL